MLPVLYWSVFYGHSRFFKGPPYEKNMYMRKIHMHGNKTHTYVHKRTSKSTVILRHRPTRTYSTLINT